MALAMFWAVAPARGTAEDSGHREASFGQSSIEIPRDRTGLRWARFNGDELLDLLISDDRQFWIYYQQPDRGLDSDHVQIIDLEGRGALYDLTDLDGDGVSEIVVLDERGIWAYAYDNADAGLVRRPEALVDSVRGLPIQHIAAAQFVFDIDDDGDADLVYPIDGKYYLYFQRDGVFTKENQVSTDSVAVRMTMGEDFLHERIVASVAIPRLNFVDLNGDGRLDLRASRDDRESFYLQAADGTIPERPSYEVDLSQFKEKGPRRGGLGARRFQFIAQDLNDDGREDYVIVSGGRIRIYKATEAGVDFSRPSYLLKPSAKSMSVALLPINEDSRPELVIFKYELPSLGRIVAGLAIGFRFEIDILGYRNEGDDLFSRRPDYRSTMIFKIPPILKLLSEIDSLTEEFESIRRETVVLSSGDYNGDGLRDAVKLVSGEANFYFSGAEEASAIEGSLDGRAGAEFYRETLFGMRRRNVTLQTLMSFVRDIAGAFQDVLIAGREPSMRLPIDAAPLDRVERVDSRDLNADGVDDLLIFEGPDPEARGDPTRMQIVHLVISNSKPLGRAAEGGEPALPAAGPARPSY